MSSTVSVGESSRFVLRQALAISVEETNTATAVAVPQVHTLDMVAMVSLESNKAMMVVMPTARPVWMSIGVETRKNGADLPNW